MAIWMRRFSGIRLVCQADDWTGREGGRDRILAPRDRSGGQPGEKFSAPAEPTRFRPTLLGVARLFGDEMYGGDCQLLHQALHCQKICFYSPFWPRQSALRPCGGQGLQTQLGLTGDQPK